MVPQSSAILIWAVRIPGGTLRCLTWQVAGQWRVGIYDEHEMYVQTSAPDPEAAGRWGLMVRREIDRLGLGERPVSTFDPDIDVTIDPFEPYDTFDDIVDGCITGTDADARARPH